MSIYSIMAFNAAHDQVQKNTADSQAIQAKKVETQTAQEQLDLNKKLDVAKVSQANNEGMMNDYIGNQLKDQINKQYKAKQDQLDAVSGLQDIAQHKAQTQAQQAAAVATQLHANDPDVQAHVATLTGIMNTQNGGQSSQPATPPMSMPDGTTSGNPSVGLPSIPGIAPVQGGVSPQNVDNQVTPQSGQAPTVQPSTPQAMPQPTQTPQVEAQPTAQSQQQGIDLSPVEQAFGMPKGSMWLNPGTMKPEISPVWKSRMEAEQRAQANYDVNHPFAEEKQQSALEKQYTDRIDKQLSNRSGGLGLMDSKVNQAVLARQIVNQYYDPQTGEYHIPPAQYTDLAMSLATLLSPGSQASDAKMEAIKQRTAAGDFNGVLQYITGSPKDATTPAMVKSMVDSIDREGLKAEDLRDKYLDKLRAQYPSSLNKDSVKRITDSSNLNPSFKEELAGAPDKQQGQQSQGQSGQTANFNYKVGQTRPGPGGRNYVRRDDGKWYPISQ